MVVGHSLRRISPFLPGSSILRFNKRNGLFLVRCCWSRASGGRTRRRGPVHYPECRCFNLGRGGIFATVKDNVSPRVSRGSVLLILLGLLVVLILRLGQLGIKHDYICCDNLAVAHYGLIC